MIDQATHLAILRQRPEAANASPAIRLGCLVSMIGHILDDSESPDRAVAELRAFLAAVTEHEAEVATREDWVAQLALYG